MGKVFKTLDCWFIYTRNNINQLQRSWSYIRMLDVGIWVGRIHPRILLKGHKFLSLSLSLHTHTHTHTAPRNNVYYINQNTYSHSIRISSGLAIPIWAIWSKKTLGDSSLVSGFVMLRIVQTLSTDTMWFRILYLTTRNLMSMCLDLVDILSLLQ